MGGGINVASVQVHVIGGSMLPLFMYRCMCWGINVASVHVHMLGESMLPVFMPMC